MLSRINCFLFIFTLSLTMGLDTLSAQADVSPLRDQFQAKGGHSKTKVITSARLEGYVQERVMEFNEIPLDQRRKLDEIKAILRQELKGNQPVQLLFICTGNSRRSQLAHVWAQTALAYYGNPDIHVYSGGTRLTAFNNRIAKTLSGAGFEVEKTSGENPDFRLRYNDFDVPMTFKSKLYNDPANPKSNFIAIVLCDDADESCPVIDGAKHRFLIPYYDPRHSDHTEEERAHYSASNAKFAREMFYLLQGL